MPAPIAPRLQKKHNFAPLFQIQPAFRRGISDATPPGLHQRNPPLPGQIPQAGSSVVPQLCFFARDLQPPPVVLLAARLCYSTPFPAGSITDQATQTLSSFLFLFLRR